MDRNIYDNDFEEFLKQKSDQYKMYPSDRVWNNIYSSLHGRKKWWALAFTLFFIGTGLLVGKELLFSNYNRMATALNEDTETFTASNNNSSEDNTARLSTRQQAATISKAAANPVNRLAFTPKNNSGAGSNLPSVVTTEEKLSKNNNEETATAVPFNNESALVIENKLLPSVPAIATKRLTSISIPQKKLVLNDQLTDKSKTIKEAVAPVNQVENAARRAEPVQFSRFSLQYYASPTISYRRLSNTTGETNNLIPAATTSNADNVNHYVNHKPAPGFEVGTNLQYKVSNNLTLFAGAQLNYSRYYIDAFKYHTEKASIALDGARAHDTVSGYTDIRNFSGYAPEQLQNKYLQLSIPVGIEIKLLGDKKLQFSVAGSVQPTFLLSSTSYLLSSDYKNYIQSPDLARGFNVHTNFEAFISYKTGSLKWQVGPQFRSQLLSSYSNQYRVREYLTEYGIKFGVTKSF